MEAQPYVARFAGGSGGPERLPARILHERVPPRQRALGVVGGERQREALELAAAPRGIRSLSALGGYG